MHRSRNPPSLLQIRKVGYCESLFLTVNICTTTLYRSKADDDASRYGTAGPNVRGLPSLSECPYLRYEALITALATHNADPWVSRILLLQRITIHHARFLVVCLSSLLSSAGSDHNPALEHNALRQDQSNLSGFGSTWSDQSSGRLIRVGFMTILFPAPFRRPTSGRPSGKSKMNEMYECISIAWLRLSLRPVTLYIYSNWHWREACSS